MGGAITAIVIILIVVAGITASILGYFRLQRHRADAVAMASYRRLAEQAVANQETLNEQLAALNARVQAVEQLLRSVG
ncbi:MULTISPECIES: hypothetical protein [Dactylosporangium]|uniref:Uncharacterized protein n=2 Tax=Dactylosporangium TaxID=35753 RepID=A0A9W6KG62_9ACTN|nr:MULTISPECIES: hypothetical protein [Dactylosporangium]UAB94071.1 hypothetical protein Dvina_38675 [Dactylosporangium vinaceum]UWZ42482.1 hypothetical protein Dmats_33635 [Dactylosporangium matsuzakiense]GLL00603.1 hypothetical protein GCM10017581_023440 [Dactylosporangium matsuzakiense]